MTTIFMMPSALDAQAFVDMLSVLYSASTRGHQTETYAVLHANTAAAYVMTEDALEFLVRMCPILYGGLHAEAIMAKHHGLYPQPPGEKIRDYQLLALCDFKPPICDDDRILLFTSERAMVMGPGLEEPPSPLTVDFGATGEFHPCYRSVLMFSMRSSTFRLFRAALALIVAKYRVVIDGNSRVPAGLVLNLDLMMIICGAGGLNCCMSADLCCIAQYRVPFPAPMIISTGFRADTGTISCSETDNRAAMFAYSYTFTWKTVFDPEVKTVLAGVARYMFKLLKPRFVDALKRNDCSMALKPSGQDAGAASTNPSIINVAHNDDLDS